MDDKLPLYEVTVDSDVYAISLVDEPAIEVDYVHLAKQNPKKVVFLEDEAKEKHMVVGPVLIPDKPIYRNQDGEEFYIQFSKESVERLAYNYIKQGYNMTSFTAQHQYPVNEVYIVESWLKTTENDKSNDLGFDCPIGTWFVGAKVNNLEVWEDIKDGKMNGFSVEAFVSLDELKLNKIKRNENKDMAVQKKNIKAESVEITDSFWDKLKGILADALNTTKVDEDVTDAVEEVADALDTEVPVDMAEEKPVDETVDNAVSDTVDAVETATETPEEAANALQDVVDSLNEEIAKKDKEIEELKKKCQKFSKRPSAKPTTKVTASKVNTRDVIEQLYRGTYKF